MDAPDLSINDMMIAVRRDVLKVTGGKQEPWDQSSLRRRFCFNEPLPLTKPSDDLPKLGAAPLGLVVDERTIEHTRWLTLQNSGSIVDLQGFLVRFPNGNYAEDASRLLRTRLRECSEDETLEQFTAKYPESEHRSEAGRRLAEVLEIKSALIDARDVPVSRPSSSIPADKSASNDTWEQAPTAFAALLAMAALPITFIICIIWESKGRDFFGGENRKDASAGMMGGIITSALSLTFARWRGRRLSGIESALYWFAFAFAMRQAIRGIFEGLDGNATLGSLIASAAVVATAGGLVRLRDSRPGSVEVAIYWLGIALSLESIIWPTDSGAVSEWADLLIAISVLATGILLISKSPKRFGGG